MIRQERFTGETELLEKARLEVIADPVKARELLVRIGVLKPPRLDLALGCVYDLALAYGVPREVVEDWHRLVVIAATDGGL